jgi:spore germination protein KC
MLKKTACVILALMTLLLGGCWDNREITDLEIVTGIGIDKTPDGAIEITAQIISPSKSVGSQSGSGSSQSSSGSTVDITAEGDTVSDAVFNLAAKAGRNMYLMHTQLMVIGEAAAEDGLENIWDYIERDHEVGRMMWVMIAKNGTAKSVLDASPDVENINAVQITNTFVKTVNFGKTAGIQAFKVSELLSEPKTGIVTSVIEPDGLTCLKDMKVQGAAVLVHSKLAGYLDTDETRGYLFAANQMNGTILNIANPEQKGKLVSIEVVTSNAKLQAEINNGKPILGIEINAQGNLTEEEGGEDLTDEKDIKDLTSESEALISQNIRLAVMKSQKVFDCDIFDFNGLLYKYHYSDFEKIADNWNELYKNADIKISVLFQLEKPGMIMKPAYQQ